MTPWTCDNVESGRYCGRKSLYFYVRPDIGPTATGRCAVHERTEENMEYFSYFEITQSEAEILEIMES